MKAALDLLKLLTERFPPGDHRRHALIKLDTGDLGLALWVGEHLETFSFDATELDDQAADLADALAAALAARTASAAG